MYVKMRQATVVSLILCSYMIWPATATNTDHEPIVHTKLGSIEGKLLKAPENNVVSDVYEFIGIPYAQPPVGKLRFKKPEPVQPWTGIRKADTWSDICVQSTIIMEAFGISGLGDLAEDCLYLNIWTPVLTTDENKAVMVFIHGGGYRGDTAKKSTYNGAVLSSMGDVVVVSMNYRLGMLGFLNLGTDEVPGNQAFWDQRQALIWVQEHIEHFGGDPKRVTIFGESAGSMSVGVHVLSPVSQGLFHHAIMQSGSPMNPNLLNSPEMAHVFTIKFATEQGCYNGYDDTKDEAILLKIVDCLREIDVSQIIRAEDDYAAHPEKGYIYPTYGDTIFPHQHTVGNRSVDLMIGYNPNEGTIFLSGLVEEIQRDKNDNSPFTLSDAIRLSKIQLGHASENLIELVIEFYFGHISESTDTDVLKQIASDVFSDPVLSCPAEYFAEYYSSQHNRVYFYQFSHRHSTSPYEEWVGVTHGDELIYIFSAAFYGQVTFTEEEKEFNRQIVNLWTTFAKTGKPQVPGLYTWPLYSENRPIYVDLKLGNFRTDIGPRLRPCNFWRCHVPLP